MSWRTRRKTDISRVEMRSVVPLVSEQRGSMCYDRRMSEMIADLVPRGERLGAVVSRTDVETVKKVVAAQSALRVGDPRNDRKVYLDS
jgi:hypothetical protein